MSHTAEYKELLVVARKAAMEAVAVIRDGAGRRSQLQIEYKGVNDLVTDVDERAQDAILSVIAAECPGHSVLAEESTEVAQRLATENPYRWIVDPLDGTTNFTHGVPPFAVSIGLEHLGEPVLGVVVNIPLDEWFVASKGAGAYLNGETIRTSATDTLAASLVTTGFPYREFDNVDAYLSVLRALMQQSQGIRRPGSASVDLAYVACGRFDGFFETGLAPWDVAAGTVLVREAGGIVSALAGDVNPLYSKHLVASNKAIHDTLRQLVGGLAST